MAWSVLDWGSILSNSNGPSLEPGISHGACQQAFQRLMVTQDHKLRSKKKVTQLCQGPDYSIGFSLNSSIPLLSWVELVGQILDGSFFTILFLC